jgi:MEMO1 family protein
MKKAIGVLLLIIAAAAGFVLRPVFNNQKIVNKNLSIFPVHFASQNDKSLYQGLESFGKIEPVKDKVYGAIVSHHLLASAEIIDLFSRLRDQKIGIIILAGPNHFNTGNAPILLSLEDYATPWGKLENNNGIGNKILDSGLAKNEEQPFEAEHSISALAGLIKFAFPEAKIVPIIIKRGSDIKQAESLGDWFSKNLPENTLVIASVDFSHHLNLEKTLNNDKKSLEILKTSNLLKIGEAEVDSRQSLALLFKLLENKQALNFNYFYTNAAFLLNNKDYQDVTSYFFAYYLKGEKNFKQYKESFLK